MLIISYQDKQYYGNSIEDVFNKYWKAQKGKKIYSTTKSEFIKNMFNAAIMHVITRKYANNEKKKMRADNAENVKEKAFNECLDTIPEFINSLQDHNYLKPIYLFAFTRATDFFYFIKLGKMDTEQLASAIKDIEQILPEEMDVLLKLYISKE